MEDAIKRIRKHIRGMNKHQFLKDLKTFDAVTCQLMVLGEAAGNTSEKFQEKYPDIPWHKVIGMRNRLIHGYSVINIETVWKTCQLDLPKLEKQIKQIKAT